MTSFFNDKDLTLRSPFCEAELLVLEKFVEQKILTRDDRGFYQATDIGKRILSAMKSL